MARVSRSTTPESGKRQIKAHSDEASSTPYPHLSASRWLPCPPIHTAGETFTTSMNFDEAIAAHAAWKQKLAVYLFKPDQSISAETLAKDNQCVLGKWIHTSAVSQQYASLPAFQELKNEHAAFHRAAAEIVKRADAGKSVAEEIELGAKSPYAECSSKVVRALLKMKASVQSAA